MSQLIDVESPDERILVNHAAATRVTPTYGGALAVGEVTPTDGSIRTSHGRSRLLSLVRVGWGVSLIRLTSPRSSGDASPFAHDQHLRLFTRVLGVRHVGEGLVCVTVPSRRVIRAGSTIDTIHMASMLGLAAVDRRRRDLVFAHAAVAACWALAASSVALQLPSGDPASARDGGAR